MIIEEKAELRAWLYELLAELELVEGVEAVKTEGPGRFVELKIQFKIEGVKDGYN